MFATPSWSFNQSASDILVVPFPPIQPPPAQNHIEPRNVLQELREKTERTFKDAIDTDDQRSERRDRQGKTSQDKRRERVELKRRSSSPPLVVAATAAATAAAAAVSAFAALPVAAAAPVAHTHLVASTHQPQPQPTAAAGSANPYAAAYNGSSGFVVAKPVIQPQPQPTAAAGAANPYAAAFNWGSGFVVAKPVIQPQPQPTTAAGAANPYAAAIHFQPQFAGSMPRADLVRATAEVRRQKRVVTNPMGQVAVAAAAAAAASVTARNHDTQKLQLMAVARTARETIQKVINSFVDTKAQVALAQLEAGVPFDAVRATLRASLADLILPNSAAGAATKK